MRSEILDGEGEDLPAGKEPRPCCNPLSIEGFNPKPPPPPAIKIGSGSPFAFNYNTITGLRRICITVRRELLIKNWSKTTFVQRLLRF